MNHAALLRSYSHCEAIARQHAKNFYYGFRLLPAEQRRRMCALYAFLRHTDDLVDVADDSSTRALRLAAWRDQFEAALDSHEPGPSPILPALVDTVKRCALPVEYLRAALDGAAMDLEPRVFATYDDLRGYCYRVASVVGLCCLHIWGYRSEGGKAEAMAESCGIALQLTNIVRDVREDLERGRLYLPTEDLERFHVGKDELSAGHVDDRVRALLEFEAGRAYALYQESRPLVDLVAPVGRPMLRAVVGIYRNLLDEIARRGYDVLAGRISLPPWRKTMITLRSLAGGAR